MPVHPKEEQAESHITDQVAKESRDSNASAHPLHHVGEKATVLEHQSKGPVISQDMPEAASKEELKKRAEELNKK